MGLIRKFPRKSLIRLKCTINVGGAKRLAILGSLNEVKSETSANRLDKRIIHSLSLSFIP